jgi:hypothetical protein
MLVRYRILHYITSEFYFDKTIKRKLFYVEANTPGCHILLINDTLFDCRAEFVV